MMIKAVPDKLSVGLLLAVSLVLVFLCYSAGLNGPFLLDDKQNFVDLLRKNPIDSWNEFLRFIVTNDSGMFGRPVSMASFAITGSFNQIEPWPFKFHNLLIHMATGVVVYFLVCRIVRQVNEALGQNRVRFVALLAAVIWMLHPLQVSTVLYAVQRMAQLSGLFTLLALLVYMQGRQLLAENQLWSRILLLVVFPACGLLSVLSKENGALIPFYIVLIESFLFRARLFSRNWKREELFYMLVFGWIPVVLAALFLLVNWDVLINYSARHYTLSERLITEVHVVGMYIKVILLPQLSDMSLYHDVAIRQQAGLSTLAIIAVFVGVPLGLWFVRKRAPLLIFGVCWFFVSHLMESTVIPLELVFEHRNYVAILGFILPVAYYLVVSIDTRRLQVATVAVLLLSLSGLTAIRAREWSNLDLMIEVAMQEQPGSLRAHTEYANVLILRKDYLRAVQVLARATEVAPYDYGALAHEIMLRCQIGLDYQDQMEELREKAPILPGTPYSLSTMESLINTVTQEFCTTLPLSDLSEINDLMLENPENNANGEYYSYILRQKGFLEFGQDNYEEGFVAFMQAYDRHSAPVILGDLIDTLTMFGFVEDAAVVLEQYREVNEKKNGIYTEDFRRMEKDLEEMRVEVERLRLEQPQEQQALQPQISRDAQ